MMFVCVSLLAICLAGCAPRHEADLRIAVAANFLPVAEDLVARHGEETGLRIALSVGSSGALFSQIVHGAPFDVFLSADRERPDELVRRGLARTAHLRRYATGVLVMVGDGAREGPVDWDWLASDAVTRIAIAHEDHAPYGRAALAAIDATPHAALIRAKLVRGESVGQAWQFLESGAVEAAFVAASQAAGREAAVVSTAVALDQHVVLPGDDPSPAARAFLAFLEREDVQATIRAAGYR